MKITYACVAVALAVSVGACSSSSKKEVVGGAAPEPSTAATAKAGGGAASLSAIDKTPVATWQALLTATSKKCKGTPDSIAAAIIKEWTASGKKVKLMTFATNVKAGGYGAAGTTTCDFVAMSIGNLVKAGTLTD